MRAASFRFVIDRAIDRACEEKITLSGCLANSPRNLGSVSAISTAARMFALPTHAHPQRSAGFARRGTLACSRLGGSVPSLRARRPVPRAAQPASAGLLDTLGACWAVTQKVVLSGTALGCLVVALVATREDGCAARGAARRGPVRLTAACAGGSVCAPWFRSSAPRRRGCRCSSCCSTSCSRLWSACSSK